VKPIKDVDRRQRLRGLVHIMADKWYRYLLQVRPALVRGEVVILDRYFYDLRVFPHPLIQKPWMNALLMRLIPEPAIAFCLKADPALIAARKHELTTAETARQIELYRGVRTWARNFHEVPADGHMPTVIDWMTEQVVRAWAQHRSPERV
jgi:thymidylate kinase